MPEIVTFIQIVIIQESLGSTTAQTRRDLGRYPSIGTSMRNKNSVSRCSGSWRSAWIPQSRRLTDFIIRNNAGLCSDGEVRPQAGGEARAGRRQSTVLREQHVMQQKVLGQPQAGRDLRRVGGCRPPQKLGERQ